MFIELMRFGRSGERFCNTPSSLLANIVRFSSLRVSCLSKLHNETDTHSGTILFGFFH